MHKFVLIELNNFLYKGIRNHTAVLTDSANPTDYLKKMRKRDSELGSFVGTDCPQVTMLTETGKKRLTLAADTEAMFRIIQSNPFHRSSNYGLLLNKKE